MKALTYHGSKDVRVETMPDPTILAADDVLLRVTATAICGSDLHLYHGKIPETKHGDIFGHEFMGVVEEAGPDVTNVAVGDRVVIPFVIACGKCFLFEDIRAAIGSAAASAQERPTRPLRGRGVTMSSTRPCPRPR